MLVVLYQLKDIENIREILRISRQFGVEVILIPREDMARDIDLLKKEDFSFEIADSLDVLYERFKDRTFVFLETYGDKYLHEENLSKNHIYVVGAEDYGIPLHEIEKARKKIIVKIPMEKPGSYNVTSSFVMMLYEIFRDSD